MTSAIAVVTLTYRGNDVQDLDGIFLEMVRGGPGEISEVRGVNWTVPGLDGQTLGNRRLHRRDIELHGFVRGTGTDEDDQREDYWDNRMTLADWFSPTVAGDLVAVVPGGATYSIEARTLPPFVFTQRVPAYAEVTVMLESVVPEWEVTGS